MAAQSSAHLEPIVDLAIDVEVFGHFSVKTGQAGDYKILEE